MARLYVGNLTSDTYESEIRDEFERFGPLRSVWVARKPPAFLEYDDPRDAADAVNKLDGFRGWRVEVSRNPPAGGRSVIQDYRDSYVSEVRRSPPRYAAPLPRRRSPSYEPPPDRRRTPSPPPRGTWRERSPSPLDDYRRPPYSGGYASGYGGGNRGSFHDGYSRGGYGGGYGGPRGRSLSPYGRRPY